MSDNEMDFFTKNILYERNYSNYAELSPLLSLQIIKLRIFKVVFFIQLIPVVYFGRKYILDYNKKYEIITQIQKVKLYSILTFYSTYL